MTNDEKLEQLFRAGDGDLDDRGFSARVLRRLRMRPLPRRWIIPLVFTLVGVGLALAISPLPDPGSMDVARWYMAMSAPSSSAISLTTCALVALLALGAVLMKEEA